MGAFKRKYKDKENQWATSPNWSCEFFIDGERFQHTLKDSDKLSKKQAERECDSLKDAKKQELYGTKTKTFADAQVIFYEDYLLKLRKRQSSTHKRVKDAYGPILSKLLDKFGRHRLDAIQRADIIDFITERRRQGIKDKTIKNDINTISAVYGYALMMSYCADRDVPNFPSIRKLLKASKPKTRYFSEDDFDKLVAQCDGAIKFIVEFDVETGLRMEELLSLRWQEVDWQEKRIHILDTKNGKDRFVPLSGRALELLQQQLQRKLGPEYVIAKKNGERYSIPEKTFKLACKKANIKYSLHDLRRTFGSWRLQGVRGVKLDISQVSKVLGHSDIAITSRVYAFLNEQEIKL